ncbi:hypothetical protein Bca4012_037750 [Brassica carinata]
MMASIDQILRQGSSIFHSASPLEEIQLSSSVNQFREPTIDVSSATASLTPILHSPRKEIATPTFSRTVGDEKNFTGKPTYLFLLFRRNRVRLLRCFNDSCLPSASYLAV